MLREKEDRDATDDDIGSSAPDQDLPMADETPQSPVDKSIEILFRNVIQEFGFTPRDVYDGIFKLFHIRAHHAAALRVLTYSKLVAMADDFSSKYLLDSISHRMISVYPYPNTGGLSPFDDWKIDFKSAQIVDNVTDLARTRERNELMVTYNSLKDVPGGSMLMGQIFEAVMHRNFSEGWEPNGPIPWPIPMASDDKDPPTFSVDSPTSPTAPLLPTPLRASAREITRVNFAYDLTHHVTLDNKYYVPTRSNNPLFDSFIIDFDSKQCTATISVFQMTIAKVHGGSSEGYKSIRDIASCVSKLLKGLGPKAKKPKVEVKYFLVCPENTPEHKWHMPDRWGKDWSKDDHCGPAFCLYIPTSVITVSCVYSPPVCGLAESLLDVNPP